MRGEVLRVTPVRLMSDAVSRAQIRVRWSNGYEALIPEGQLVIATPKYLNENARAAVRYWGSECEANPGSTFSADYALDCALKYGHTSWSECTSAEKSEILAAFAEGRKAEAIMRLMPREP